MYMSQNLYDFLGVKGKPIYSSRFILYILGVTILIFVVCALVEWLRQIIFKFIYNRKISKKIRDKYNNWIHTLKFTSY